MTIAIKDKMETRSRGFPRGYGYTVNSGDYVGHSVENTELITMLLPLWCVPLWYFSLSRVQVKKHTFVHRIHNRLLAVQQLYRYIYTLIVKIHLFLNYLVEMVTFVRLLLKISKSEIRYKGTQICLSSWRPKLQLLKYHNANF